MGRRQVIILLVIAFIAGTAGYYLSQRLFGQVPNQSSAQPSYQSGQMGSGTTDSIIGTHRADYRHGDSDGNVVTADEFDGQIVLVNFWATWCKPCREEMPMLSGLQLEYATRGLQIVGIALDDVERARQFALEAGVEYPILVGSTDVMVTIHNYGNRSGTLPYSVLIDRQGTVRWSHLGPLERATLMEKIAEIL